MDQKSDLNLVLAVQRGSHSSLAQLVDRYQKPLLAYARHLGADSHTAQDIVQQSFINAYQNINSFNPKYKFSSWIYRIVHNQTVNHLQKQSHAICLDIFDFFAEIIPSKVNLEDQILKQD